MLVVLKKYRTETQLLLITLIIAAVVTLTFSILRVWQGNLLIAGIDLYFFTGLCAAIYHILKTTKTRKASIFIMLIAYSAIIPIIYLSAPEEINWVFAIMAGSFFMLKPVEALCLNTLAFALCVPHFLSLWIASDFVLSIMPMVLMNIFCFMFAKIIWIQKASLSELAVKDPLTGAGNRRALDESMNYIQGVHKRRTSKDSIISFDIDHFKRINDLYGHLEGDRVLVKITQIIRGRIRLTDSLYRQGGEEFLIMAVDTPRDTAVALAEELRQLVENIDYEFDRKITISFGVAELYEGESSKDCLDSHIKCNF